ncbi:hypothetical protein JCM15519_25280 [Fundidesulfovibrio butyratiphilus]
MAIPENIARFISRIVYTVKTESVEWRQAHLPELEKMRQDRAVAKLELQQDLERLEIRFEEERKRIRLDEQRQTAQFAEFLESIDDLKADMLASYTSMPKPIALMIHHHAAELLKQAWFSQDMRERVRQQSRFTDLMLTITEDLTALRESDAAKALPEKTLAFINRQIEE